MFHKIDPISAVRWQKVKNTDATQAPAFAILEVTGWDNPSKSVTVASPTADNQDPTLLLVNGPGVIAPNAYGQATRDFPIMAAVATGAAFGDAVGTAATNWTLQSGKTGFKLWKAESGGLAVVAAVGGGSGGDDYALLDAVAGGGTPYFTDLTNSLCFYSAKLWTGWNTAGGTNQGLTFGEAIWLFGVYNPIVYNDTTPGTPFKLDGNSVHKVKYTGKSYNPTDGSGAHGSRRVFFTTEAGWAWRVDCAASGPATENEG